MKTLLLTIISVILVNGDGIYDEYPPAQCPPGHVMDFLRGFCWKDVDICKASLFKKTEDDEEMKNSVDDERIVQPNFPYSYDLNYPRVLDVTQTDDSSTQLFEQPGNNEESDDQQETDDFPERVDDFGEVASERTDVVDNGDQEEDKPVGLSLYGNDQRWRVFSECNSEVLSLRANINSLISLAAEREQFTSALRNRVSFLQQEQEHHISLLSDQNTVLQDQAQKVEKEQSLREECESEKSDMEDTISELRNQLEQQIEKNKKKDRHIAKQNIKIGSLQMQISAYESRIYRSYAQEPSEETEEDISY